MEQNNDHIYFEESWNREPPKEEVKKRTLKELHKAMIQDKEEQRDEDWWYWSL